MQVRNIQSGPRSRRRALGAALLSAAFATLAALTPWQASSTFQSAMRPCCA